MSLMGIGVRCVGRYCDVGGVVGGCSIVSPERGEYAQGYRLPGGGGRCQCRGQHIRVRDTMMVRKRGSRVRVRMRLAWAAS